MTTEDDFQNCLDIDITDWNMRLKLSDYLLEIGDNRWYGYRWLGENKKYPYRDHTGHWNFFLYASRYHTDSVIPIELITNLIWIPLLTQDKIQKQKTRKECEDNLSELIWNRYIELSYLTNAFETKNLEVDVWKSASQILQVKI